MYEKLNERLAKVKAQLRKKQKWEKQLADYQREWEEKRHLAVELKRKLEDEEADVEKLSGLSLTNLFSTIAGNKEDRLKEDKKEAAAAHLKYDEALNAITHIEAAIQQTQEQLDTLSDVDQEYEEILLEKERLIEDTHSPLTEELYDLSERSAECQSYLAELDEAMKAGEEVSASLEDAIHALDSAKNWGTWDMLGGGMISTAIKHDHIDDAKESIHLAQSKMRAFQKELLDVDQSGDWEIDISGLLTFADYFFDGLISDWFVQEKINDSLDQTVRQQENIEQIMHHLQADYESKRDELESIEKKRRSLIEQSN